MAIIITTAATAINVVLLLFDDVAVLLDDAAAEVVADPVFVAPVDVVCCEAEDVVERLEDDAEVDVAAPAGLKVASIVMLKKSLKSESLLLSHPTHFAVLYANVTCPYASSITGRFCEFKFWICWNIDTS